MPRSPSVPPPLHMAESAPALMGNREFAPADAKAVKRLQAPPRHVLLVEVKPGPTGMCRQHTFLTVVAAQPSRSDIVTPHDRLPLLCIQLSAYRSKQPAVQPA
jgi:hypothetical protein